MMSEHSSPLAKSLLVPLSVTLLAGGIYLLGKQMDAEKTPPTISVEGQGRIFSAPDIAVLQFGVNTGRQPTAQKTLEVLTENMNSVIDVVKKNGVEDNDITTQSLWLNPAYDWIDGQQISRGFEATQNLSVKVRNLDKIGTILTAAAGAGANQIGGVSLTIDDPAELKAQAREKAIDDAEAKAKVLAESLGVRLGKIVSYTEGFSGVPGPYYDSMAYGRGGGGGAEMAVPTGEQEVNVTVTINYEIK